MRRVSSYVVAGLLMADLVIAGATTVGQSRQGEANGNPEARKLKNPVPATAESIKSGEQLFRRYCRFCHGPDAKGNGPMAPQGTHPPNLTDEIWEHGSSDGEIFTNIRDGVGPQFAMKPNKSKMTDREMWDLVNYIRSIGAGAGSR
jgi:mono/diheme cytochrome c family protein